MKLMDISPADYNKELHGITGPMAKLFAEKQYSHIRATHAGVRRTFDIKSKEQDAAFNWVILIGNEVYREDT